MDTIGFLFRDSELNRIESVEFQPSTDVATVKYAAGF